MHFLHHCHKEITKKLNLSEIGNEFVGRSKHHLALSGKILPTDLLFVWINKFKCIISQSADPAVILIINFNINSYNGQGYEY